MTSPVKLSLLIVAALSAAGCDEYNEIINSSSPDNIVATDTAIYFNAKIDHDSGAAGPIWVLEEGDEVPVMLAERDGIDLSAMRATMHAFGDTIYADGNDLNLWRLDRGAPPSQIDHGSGSQLFPRLSHANGPMMYFMGKSARNPCCPSVPWFFDGVGPPARLVDLQPELEERESIAFATWQDVVYIATTEQREITALWQHDGVNPPERVLIGATSIPFTRIVDMVAARDVLYLFGDGDEDGAMEIWRHDGVGDPVVVGALPPVQLVRVRPYPLSIDDVVYLISNDSAGTERLWRVDAGGATPLFANLEVLGSTSFGLHLLAGEMLFYAIALDRVDDEGNPLEGLWAWDLSGEPEFLGAIGRARKPNPVVLGDTLYFTGVDDEAGAELWRYDGDGPPHMVVDLFPGSRLVKPTPPGI